MIVGWGILKFLTGMKLMLLDERKYPSREFWFLAFQEDLGI